MQSPEEINRTAGGPEVSPWPNPARPASGCWTVAAVIISSLLAVAMLGNAATTVRTGARDTSQLIIGFAIYAAMWLGLLSFVVRRFDAGHKWARLTLAGLSAWMTLMTAPLLLPTYDGVDGTPLVRLGAAALLLVLAPALWLSYTPTVNLYFDEREERRRAARPDPGPPPPSIRLAVWAWRTAFLLVAALFAVVLVIGWPSSIVSTSFGGLAVVIALRGVGRFGEGSRVARRWFTALGTLSFVLIPDVVSSSMWELEMIVELMLIAVAATALVVTYLPAGRAFVRAATPG